MLHNSDGRIRTEVVLPEFFRMQVVDLEGRQAAATSSRLASTVSFSTSQPMALFHMLCGAVLTGSLVSMGTSALAWGEDGHRIVARLAEAQLTASARQDVDHLLALEPGATLASISTWADEHRSPATAAWHYVNLPRGDCTFQPVRDCPDGRCVVAAIEKQAEILRAPGDDKQRLVALKYFVHFVADVHQPLHAGFGEDRGGNSFQVQAFMRGSNLHAVWDTGLIRAMQQDNETLVQNLLAHHRPSLAPTFSPSGAAEESCRIVSKTGFYPDRLVTPEYIETYLPIVTYQLSLAGARLAQALNAAFARR